MGHPKTGYRGPSTDRPGMREHPRPLTIADGPVPAQAAFSARVDPSAFALIYLVALPVKAINTHASLCPNEATPI